MVGILDREARARVNRASLPLRHPRDRESHTSTQTASIFRIRTFNWLVDAVGSENIALGLDSTLSRVTELISGEEFAAETAFHIETMRGLPDSFFDQPNPALSSTTIDRLKDPLDFVSADAESGIADELGSHVSRQALTDAPNATTTDLLPGGTDMPKNTAAGFSKAHPKSKAPQLKATVIPVKKKAPAKTKPSIKRSAQQSLPLNDKAAVQNMRRANLHILTARQCWKAHFCSSNCSSETSKSIPIKSR